ncbi:MAG: hypothetical protein PHW76_02375 [Alphaproteobacteria bacterium]|nr:hypothetical protein [Alphaproteobacteria bacterium]
MVRKKKQTGFPAYFCPLYDGIRSSPNNVVVEEVYSKEGWGKLAFFNETIFYSDAKSPNKFYQLAAELVERESGIAHYQVATGNDYDRLFHITSFGNFASVQYRGKAESFSLEAADNVQSRIRNNEIEVFGLPNERKIVFAIDLPEQYSLGRLDRKGILVVTTPAYINAGRKECLRGFFVPHDHRGEEVSLIDISKYNIYGSSGYIDDPVYMQVGKNKQHISFRHDQKPGDTEKKIYVMVGSKALELEDIGKGGAWFKNGCRKLTIPGVPNRQLRLKTPIYHFPIML